MRDEWARDVIERANAYWTDARVEELGRGKTLLIDPREGAVLLRTLGLTHRDGSIPPDRMRKYFQINHMIAAIGPSLRELLALDRPIRIVDAACGRSYLNLLLAWMFKYRYARTIQILGLERRADLVQACRAQAAQAQLADEARYAEADLSSVTGTEVVHLFDANFGPVPIGSTSPVYAVIALHACDQATDHALALAVDIDAHLIAASPCCHAELAAKWKAPRELTNSFSSIQQSPHLRRETAALVTDAMRVELLRSVGYEVWALEFVPTEHTPKNTLIRAMRREGTVRSRAAYDALRVATGGDGIELANRLDQQNPHAPTSAHGPQ